MSTAVVWLYVQTSGLVSNTTVEFCLKDHPRDQQNEVLIASLTVIARPKHIEIGCFGTENLWSK